MYSVALFLSLNYYILLNLLLYLAAVYVVLSVYVLSLSYPYLTHEATTLLPFQNQKDPEGRKRIWQEAVDSLQESPWLLNVLLQTNHYGSQAATGVKINAAFPHLTEGQMQDLIKAGVNLSIRHEGAKMHFWAVRAANVPVVRVLLINAQQAELDVRDVDTEGNTLLHWAVLKTVRYINRLLQVIIDLSFKVF